jgi:hypothetical protein
VKGFKGFDKYLKCHDLQYEIGKTTTHDGKISLCKSGLHFCENPLNVLSYYSPSDSRFAEIEAQDVDKECDSDTKRVAKSLHIKAELSLSALISAGVKFILDKVDFTNAKQSNTGNRSAATNTGERSAATNTGNSSAAMNTGDSSAATNTGKYGTAISLGIEGRASGSIGNFLVLSEWEYKGDTWKRIAMGLAKVDGKKIKADTFYVLKGGKFVEFK